MKRVLKRRVIIREYDYKKVEAQVLAPLNTMGLTETLYDRVSFMPLNQEALEKLKVMEILKGKKSSPLLETEYDLTRPASLVYDLKDYLYDERYYTWRVFTDADGYLCVRSRANTPASRLGWATFEKDLESRI